MPSTGKPRCESPSDERHCPVDRWMGGQCLKAFPAQVIGRVAGVEYGVEHELYAAGARADDEIDAGYRLGEALARIGAHAFDGEQQRAGEGDGAKRDTQREAACPGALQGESQDRFHAGTAAVTRLMSCSASLRPKWAARRSSWLTNSKAAPASVASRSSRSTKICWRGASSAEVGSSAMSISGLPMRARAAATRCCWPTQNSAAGWRQRLRAQVEMRQQAFGLFTRITGALPAPRRKGARQQDVVDRGQPGQQVELLEQEADAVGAQTIACPAGEFCHFVAENLKGAMLGQCDAAQQTEQRALAAAARAMQENMFAGSDVQLGNVEAGPGLARPAKDQIGNADGAAAHLSGLPVQHRLVGCQAHGALAPRAGALHFKSIEPLEVFENRRLDTFEGGRIGATEYIACVDVGVVFFTLMGVVMFSVTTQVRNFDVRGDDRAMRRRGRHEQRWRYP